MSGDINELKGDLGEFNKVYFSNSSDYVYVHIAPNAKIRLDTVSGENIESHLEIELYDENKVYVSNIWFLKNTNYKNETYSGTKDVYYAKIVRDENISISGEISLIDNDVISFIYDSMLDFETIPNTVQSIIFENGKVSSVSHKKGNLVVRKDTFTYSDSTIIELRTLYNGKTKTITTNLETIESEVN